MVSTTLGGRNGVPVGSAQSLCSLGINSVASVGAPVALPMVLREDASRPVQVACSFPTSLATTTMGCEATVPAVPYRRFCPCVLGECDALEEGESPDLLSSQWLLGTSGDSCTSTCAAAGSVCDPAPMKRVNTEAALSVVLGAAVDASSGQLLGEPIQQYCAGGVNVFDFAVAPAVATAYDGASNTTFCNFPSSVSAGALQNVCDVSYPNFGASRLCSCRAPEPARKLTVVEKVVAVKPRQLRGLPL